jgi:hypothetical protein
LVSDVGPACLLQAGKAGFPTFNNIGQDVIPERTTPRYSPTMILLASLHDSAYYFKDFG